MGEGRRKSWREIDAMRDRGGRSRGGRYGRESALERALREDPRLKQKYLEEAENLFRGPKGRPEHARDLQAVHDAYGTPRFPGAVKHYVDIYGMPDEWRTLILLLDLKEDPETVIRAMEALRDLYESKGQVEKKGLKSKLRVLSMTSDDMDVRDAADAILAGL